MLGTPRAIPAARDARSGVLAAFLIALVALTGFPAGADELDDSAASPADDLPAATSLSKVTWSKSKGFTRLEFHGVRLPTPRLARTSATGLILDFIATDASSIPSTLPVKTDEIASVVRIPASIGALPDDVSCRFVIVLAREDVAQSIEERDGVVLLSIGDADADAAIEIAPQEPSPDDAAGPPAIVDPPRVVEQKPDFAEMLDRPQSIQSNASMSIRAAPSAIATIAGSVEPGQSRVIDARRGEWAHLQDGGWLRLPQVIGPALEQRVTTQRSPAAWSVVTLGTNLTIVVEEVLPGDERSELLTRLYADPVQLARFRVTVDPHTPYSFRLPSKKGRVTLELPGGRQQESLDPTAVKMKDSGSRARVDLIMAAPPLAAGGTFETFLVFPRDVDFLSVTGARVEVNGQVHRLFRIPGSGEAPSP